MSLAKASFWRALQDKGLSFFFAALPYIVLTAICFAVLYHSYDLGEIDISYPFEFGDQLSMSAMIKQISETGGWWFNPRLGGDFGQDLSSYPYVDALSLGIMFLISLFTDNPFLVFNLFFFLTFFLCAYTAYFAMKKMGIDPVCGVVCSALFSFLPYHMMRYCHLLLTAYFMIPLVVLACYWMLNGLRVSCRREGESYARVLSRNRNVALSCVYAVLVSSTGIYYAVFSAFFIAVVEIMLLFRHEKGQRKPLMPLVLIAIIVLGVLLNYLPNIIFAALSGEGGAQGQSSVRSIGDAEKYSLTLVPLLFPSVRHRSEAFRLLTGRYTESSAYVNENVTAALGLIGAIGFVSLLLLLLRRKKDGDGSKMHLATDLSKLNIAGFLLGTTGGIGAVIAYTLNTGILRGYNRVSVFLGFFSLVLVAVLLTALKEKMCKSGSAWKRIACLVLVLVVLVFGIWDQTFRVFHGKEEQDAIISEVDSDRTFIEEIEGDVSEGSKIFELPYSSYPWGPEYPLLKGYLYSDDLIWSFGGILDSNADLWAREVSSLDTDDMVERLRQEGYSGIYVDESTYEALLEHPNHDTTVSTNRDVSVILDELGELLGSPLVSPDGRKYFYSIR